MISEILTCLMKIQRLIANKNYVVINGTTLIIGDTILMFVIGIIIETNRFDMFHELNCSKINSYTPKCKIKLFGYSNLCYL